MNDYPLPASAVALWLAGDTIFIRLPPAEGRDKGHVVNVSADEFGMKNLLWLLRERTKATDFRVGTKAAPVQYDLDHIGRAMRQAQMNKSAPALTLDDLDLDI